MARLTDAILQADSAYAEGRYAPTIDLKHGASFGFEVDMPSYVSNTQYIRRNLIARLIEAPRGFQYLPNPSQWIAALKSLIELHPKTWEGFNAQLTVEHASTPFGGAGEEQESVSNVTRARPAPSAAYVEKYGRPIATFWDQYILELLGDPITKIPNVVTRANAQGAVADLLPDFVGFTVLFFEPDPTFTKIDKAWLITNMMPKAGAPVEGRRDLTAPGDQSEFNIEFTGISQVGFGVNQFAQTLLTAMNITGANPNLRPAFVGDIDPNVSAVTSGIGDQITADAQTAVTP